jgi:hypothetical protein
MQRDRRVSAENVMRQKEQGTECNETEGGVQRTQRDRRKKAENAMRQKEQGTKRKDTEKRVQIVQ